MSLPGSRTLYSLLFHTISSRLEREELWEERLFLLLHCTYNIRTGILERDCGQF